MGLKLEDIRFCKICSSMDLIHELALTIDDVDNDGEIVVNCRVCNDCSTVHWIEDGKLAYQFFPNKEEFKWVEMVVDQEVHLRK